MSLVLNTNIDALIAQNSLTTSGNKLTTALQQLSSGLQINTAADNAAGYAIAQGMTSQINGLNQASQNANNGVSLTQTAQGALTEITNDLQTMRNLAVQSLNGTNSAQDRADLNQQFNQLAADINQVASTASFNGVQLLDGSFQGQTFQIGANAGQTITVASVASVATSNLGQLYTSTAVNPANYTSNGNATTATTSAGVAVANGDSGTFSITIGSGASAKNLKASVTLTGTQSTDLATVAAAITQATGSSGVVATVDSAGTGIQLSSTTQQSVSISYAPTSGQSESLTTFGLAAATGGVGATSTTLNLSGTSTYSAASNAINGTTDTLQPASPYTATSTSASEGTTALSATSTGTYSVDIGGATYTTGTIGAGTSGTFSGTLSNDLGVLAAGLNAVSAFKSAGYTASVNTAGTGITITNSTATSAFTVSGGTYTAVATTGSITASFNGTAGVTATGTAAPTGTITATVGGVAFTTANITGLNGNPYNDATVIANALNQSTTTGTVGGASVSLASQGYTASVNSQNQVVLTGGSTSFTASLTFNAGPGVSGGLTFGTGGALTVTNSSVAAASTLANGNVSTIDSANKVLIQIDSALQQLATTGAQLGAYQNRFQAAITGLQTDATNLSSAKSGIVDTNYAQATSSLAKAQILQQASTSMVAQANTIPQNILTLLQKLP